MYGPATNRGEEIILIQINIFQENTDTWLNDKNYTAKLRENNDIDIDSENVKKAPEDMVLPGFAERL